MNFGEFIKRTRNEKDISLRELARKIGISASYLNEIEHGSKRPPKSAVINNIAAALQFRYDDKCRLYDLAAAERGEVSADLVNYIMDNKAVREALRSVIKYMEDKT